MSFNKNKSAKLAKLLCVVVLSGLEEMFQELGEPVAIGEFLPPPVMDDAMYFPRYPFN